MKKLLLLAAILLLPTTALAVPTCSQYGPGCSLYTKGITEIMQVEPLIYSSAGKNFVGFAETSVHNLGLDEFVTFVGGTPDDVTNNGWDAILVSGIQQLQTNKFEKPSGTSAQYVRGDGSLATLPIAASRVFNYPARALNSCFQISSTKDADFHYAVDISAALVIGSGTATITSYTNSGCTTGTQVMSDRTVATPISGTTSINLDNTLPAGRWAKITVSTTGLGASSAIRASQAEVVQP